MRINVENGKYTFVKKGITIDVLRHGNPWISGWSEGFNALMSLLYDLDAARVVLDVARRLGDDAPREIKDALEKHRSLVDDREPPSAWCGLYACNGDHREPPCDDDTCWRKQPPQ